jgi:hypothetical protein
MNKEIRNIVKTMKAKMFRPGCFQKENPIISSQASAQSLRFNDVPLLFSVIPINQNLVEDPD